MQDRNEQAANAFYRVILLGSFGVVLIAFGESIFRAIGFGLLALMVVLHMTSISKWEAEEITAAIREVAEAKK